jgi:asparagine synthase (glutamine-hydrolysing)
MCGIAAIFAHKPDAPPVDRDELLRIRERMTHRGPDGEGIWISDDQRVGLAHRRLSIIDLSEAGAQPMWNAERTLCIIYNGEIYNYAALREQLIARGYRFNSHCDTEVLLQLYADKGAAMLNDVRGMYAFAIWDARERSLFCARDPFGIKPLYYSDERHTIRIASSMKALLAGARISRARDPAAQVGFYLWGSVPDPFTFYKNIRALPAGHSMTVRADAAPELREFCSISGILRDAEAEWGGRELQDKERHELLHSALRESAEYHLVADVPVGVFLSSGLDSSTLAALISESHNDVRTVTLGFEEFRGSEADETPLAEVVARQYGTTHQTIAIARRDFEAEADRLFEAMDRPSIDGVNTYFVSLAAKRAGLKVALSGLGGDELFGGYPSFRDIPRIVQWAGRLPPLPAFGRDFRVITAPILKRFTSPKYAGVFEYGSSYAGAYLLRRSLYMPWELPAMLGREVVREGWERLHTIENLSMTCDSLGSARLKVSALELSWYMRHQLLRDSDWAGMAHSLEIRVPFVDVQLLKQIAPLLASRHPPTKHDMASSPAQRLPLQVLARPKTGFSVPVRDWLLQSIDPLAHTERGLRGWARYVFERFSDDGEVAHAAVNQPDAERHHAVGSHRNGSRRSRIPPKNILIYRIGQLGDTVIALPAMWSVRENFPDARLTLLCDEHPHSHYVLASDLLKNAGIFDEFLAYNVGKSASGAPRDLVQLLQTLRGKKFDTLVYLAPSGRTAARVQRDKLFFRAAGISNFIGMSGFPPLPPRRGEKPLAPTARESELLLLRLRESGLRIRLHNPRFEIGAGAKEEREIDDWLSAQQSADAGRPWIAVAPGSKMPAKQWPIERYDAVVRDLIGSFDIWPVVFGGTEDSAIGAGLIERWDRGYNAAGALGVRAAQLAMKRCALYIGNDTGTMHLAAAAGVPCVAIFSSRERPGMWYPTGSGHRVFRSDIECEGCQLTICVTRQNECLRRIDAQQVSHAAAEMLTQVLGAAAQNSLP